MEVRQLQIFCALAEELNFTRTAERVHTVQSNVTTQIRSLEEELGTPLFDRLAKRVVLTDAGQRFLPYAQKALTAMIEGQSAVCHGSEPAGPLRIGAPESVLTYRLPEVLQCFRKRHPQVQLIFRPHWDETLWEALESGRLDMAIRMIDTVDHPQCASVRLRTEKVYLIAHPEHVLARKRAVEPSDLAGEMLLLTEAGCAYRKKLDELLAAHKVRVGNVTEFSSVEAHKTVRNGGHGNWIAARDCCGGGVEQETSQDSAVGWPDLDIATHIVWHKDKWLSPGMVAFLDLLQEKLKAA